MLGACVICFGKYVNRGCPRCKCTVLGPDGAICDGLHHSDIHNAIILEDLSKKIMVKMKLCLMKVLEVHL